MPTTLTPTGPDTSAQEPTPRATSEEDPPTSTYRDSPTLLFPLKTLMLAPLRKSPSTPSKTLMGVLQHHDSAPGTEKQAVADNYNALLARSLNMARDNLFNALQGSLIEAEPNLDDMFECGRMNATYTSCPYA